MMRSRFGIALLAGLLLTACGHTPPPAYYTMTALAGQADAASKVSLGLGPVRFPGYLSRTRILRHEDSGRLSLAESRRWAEPLDENFSRILGENLARLLSSDKVLRYPWPAWRQPAYQLVVDVIRFDANAQGEVELIVQWALLRQPGDRPLREARSRYRRPAGTDYDSLVAAHSRVLADFAAELANVIQQLGDSD